MNRNMMYVLLILGVLGCGTNLSVSYWMPAFEHKAASGTGSDTVNVKSDFGVETDDAVFVYEVVGKQGTQAFRANYWKIEGAGTSVIGPGGVNFADHNYLPGDQTSTTLDLTSIGATYEPGLVNNPRFTLRLIVGANLINFNMVADDITTPPAPGNGEVHLPDTGSTFESLGYMPVPTVGLGIEAAFNRWLYLTVRGLYFDTANLGLSLDADASYLGIEAALVFGKPGNHIQGTIGYRYAHAEYFVDNGGGDTDSGDSTLDGISGSIVVVF